MLRRKVQHLSLVFCKVCFKFSNKYNKDLNWTKTATHGLHESRLGYVREEARTMSLLCLLSLVIK